MTKHEKMILLVVTLLVVTKLGFFAREFFIAYHYGAAGLSPSDKRLWESASLLWGCLVNVGVGAWLFSEARAAKLTSWPWGLFGLCFNLVAVVLFYVVQIYTRVAAAKD